MYRFRAILQLSCMNILCFVFLTFWLSLFFYLFFYSACLTLLAVSFSVSVAASVFLCSCLCFVLTGLSACQPTTLFLSFRLSISLCLCLSASMSLCILYLSLGLFLSLGRPLYFLPAYFLPSTSFCACFSLYASDYASVYMRLPFFLVFCSSCGHLSDSESSSALFHLIFFLYCFSSSVRFLFVLSPSLLCVSFTLWRICCVNVFATRV